MGGGFAQFAPATVTAHWGGRDRGADGLVAQGAALGSQDAPAPAERGRALAQRAPGGATWPPSRHQGCAATLGRTPPAPQSLAGSEALRLRLLEEHRRTILELDRRDKEITKELAKLVRRVGSTLDGLCGLDIRSTAEILVEVGDPRRFTEGGFARFSGTAPLPASSGEGSGQPVRHRR